VVVADVESASSLGAPLPHLSLAVDVRPGGRAGLPGVAAPPLPAEVVELLLHLAALACRVQSLTGTSGFSMIHRPLESYS